MLPLSTPQDFVPRSFKELLVFVENETFGFQKES